MGRAGPQPSLWVWLCVMPCRLAAPLTRDAVLRQALDHGHDLQDGRAE